MTEFGHGGNGDYPEEMGETYWHNEGGYGADDQPAPDILPDEAYDYDTPHAETPYDTGNLPIIRAEDEIAIVPNAFRHNAPHTQTGEDADSRLPKNLFAWTGNPTHAQYPAENRPAENVPPVGLLGKLPFGNFETEVDHHGYDLDRPAGPVVPEEPAASHGQTVEPTPLATPYIETEPTGPKTAEDYIAEAWDILGKWPHAKKMGDQAAVASAIARGLRNRDLRDIANKQQQQLTDDNTVAQDNEPTHAIPDSTEQHVDETAPEDTQAIRPQKGVIPAIDTSGSPPLIHQALAYEIENRQIEAERQAFEADPLRAALPRRMRPNRPTSLADAGDYPRPPAGTYIDYDGARVVIPLPKQTTSTPAKEIPTQLPADPRSNRPDTGLVGLVERYAAELAAAEADPNTPRADLVMMRERQQWLESQRADQPAPAQESPQPQPVPEASIDVLERILNRLPKL